MTVEFTRLLADTLVMAGESPDLASTLLPDEDFPVLTAERIVRTTMGSAATDLTLQQPLDLLDEVEELPKEIRWCSSTTGVITLPDDFLRLHSLRMPGWGRTLRRLEPEESLRGALGEGAPSWMSPAGRPMAMLGSDSRGACLIFRGPRAGDDPIPERATYIPRPRVWPDGALTISASIYPLLLERLAGILNSR